MRVPDDRHIATPIPLKQPATAAGDDLRAFGVVEPDTARGRRVPDVAAEDPAENRTSRMGQWQGVARAGVLTCVEDRDAALIQGSGPLRRLAREPLGQSDHCKPGALVA